MPSLIDSKIANCKSWADFEQLVAGHENKDKGDLFERLTQLFLQTSSTYKSKIKHVWWCNNPYTNEFPEAVRQKLNLPVEDEGIDLICETFEGKYWSVQAKYRTDNDKALTTKELSKFLSLSFVTSGQIELGLITHTSTKPVRKQDLMGRTTELGLQNFLEMSPEQWEQIAGICTNNAPLPPIARTPEPFQRAAIANAIKHFQTEDNARGKLIMPCGTGKSLMAYWMAREMNAKSIILAVPSLALIKQSLGDWTAEFLAEGIRPEWLAVCSDDSVGSMKEADSTVSTVYEAGIPATTDQFEIMEFLEKRTDDPKVIFTTYQSSKVLAEACTTARFTAELLIADEAHKTVGSSAKKFATLLSDDNIHINKRLFMTATERVIRGAGEGEVVSMDDASVYGEVFHQMSFAQAIEEDIICDYKILTLFVPESEASDLVSQRQAVDVQQGNRKIETDAHSLAVGLAVEKAFKKYGVKRAITFHSSIKRAESFAHQQREFGGLAEDGLEIDCQTISSKQTAGQRSKRLHDFKSKDLALLSNARCLTEGVDIPSIDCVAFVDPKQSVIDIVQAAGRAMRKSDETGKDHGYILIPISVPPGYSLEEFGDLTDFKSMTRIITSLSTQDERIAEELRSGVFDSGGGHIIIDGDYAEAVNLDFADFNKRIGTHIWKSVGRSNWRPFEEAREYVRSLGLQNTQEYTEWCRTDFRPPDIPAEPASIYKLKGWLDWADFLDSMNRKNVDWMPFEEARQLVRNQGLSNMKGYRKWRRLSGSTFAVPAKPDDIYQNEGWIDAADWLGTKNRKNVDWMPFTEARDLVQSKNLKTVNEYKSFRQGDEYYLLLPSEAGNVYRDDGWVSWADFLGIRPTKGIDYLPYEEAREFVIGLGLKNQKDWFAWRATAERPLNIPSKPERIYKDTGWKGIGDWLGTGKVRDKEFMSFEDARTLVQSKKVKSSKDWQNLYLEGVPRHPNEIYKNTGWLSWSDWFGPTYRNARREYRSLDQARAFASGLGLRNRRDWEDYIKANELPYDIPRYPNYSYKNKGWTGWGDFLGTGNTRPGSKWQREEDPET